MYVVRSPRVRAPKRIPSTAERVPAAVSMSSCFSNEPLVHRPFSTPTSVPARGIARARRRSSDTAIGLDRPGAIRRESESRGLPASSDPLGRRPSRKVDPSPLMMANDVFGWDGTQPGPSSSSTSSRRRSMADPSFGSPNELLTPPFGSAPWGVPGAYDYSPPTQTFSVAYSNAPHPTHHSPSYHSHPRTFTPPHPAQSSIQHRHPSVAAHPASLPTPSSMQHVHADHQQSPLSYFAPLPAAPPVPHHGEYYTTGGPPPPPPAASYAGLGYYPSSASNQPRRASMPSFRPPPASASALFKSRAAHVEVLREEAAEHVHHPEARRASVLEPVGGGWEELSYAGRR